MCTSYQYAPANPCGCNAPYYQSISYPLNCDSSASPCPIQLDAQCVIYHKLNNEVSKLTNLNISNGGTLEITLETIDSYIAQLNINNLSLPYLKGKYSIINLQQFASKVDTELGLLNASVETLEDSDAPMGRWLGNLSSDPGGSIDGDYWWNTTSSSLKIKVNNGVVKTITTS